MTAAALPPDLAHLIQRLAEREDGLALFDEALLESAAVILGVHPLLLDDARTFFRGDERRELLIAEIDRARARPTRPARVRRAAPVPPADADALLQEASRHPLGLEFFQRGSPEAVAIEFGVHPFLVFQARQKLARGKP